MSENSLKNNTGLALYTAQVVSSAASYERVFYFMIIKQERKRKRLERRGMRSNLNN